MARYFGKVGYGISHEVPEGSGVWKLEIIERTYFGDTLRDSVSNQTGYSTNDNINLGSKFSILADPFAYQNSQYIKYIEYMDALWKVTSVEVQYPRLIITVGGIWNGEQDGSSGGTETYSW